MSKMEKILGTFKKHGVKITDDTATRERSVTVMGTPELKSVKGRRRPTR